MKLNLAELAPVVHGTVDVRNAKSMKDQPGDLSAFNHLLLLLWLLNTRIS